MRKDCRPTRKFLLPTKGPWPAGLILFINHTKKNYIEKKSLRIKNNDPMNNSIEIRILKIINTYKIRLSNLTTTRNSIELQTCQEVVFKLCRLYQNQGL